MRKLMFLIITSTLCFSCSQGGKIVDELFEIGASSNTPTTPNVYNDALVPPPLASGGGRQIAVGSPSGLSYKVSHTVGDWADGTMQTHSGWKIYLSVQGTTNTY